MSKGFQSVNIVGVVGRDAESRSTPNGHKVVSFSVAVDCGFGDSAYVEWFNCVAFRDRAEFAEKYIRKGKPISVVGKLKTRSWDQNGEKKYRTELIVDLLDFFGGESKSGGTQDRPARQSAAPQTRQPAPQPTRAEPDDPFAENDDIPF